jgi:hypothetical protein
VGCPPASKQRLQRRQLDPLRAAAPPRVKAALVPRAVRLHGAAMPVQPVLLPLPLAHRAVGRRPASTAMLEVVGPLTWLRVGSGLGSGLRVRARARARVRARVGAGVRARGSLPS